MKHLWNTVQCFVINRFISCKYQHIMVLLLFLSIMLIVLGFGQRKHCDWNTFSFQNQTISQLTEKVMVSACVAFFPKRNYHNNCQPWDFQQILMVPREWLLPDVFTDTIGFPASGTGTKFLFILGNFCKYFYVWLAIGIPIILKCTLCFGSGC